MVTNNIKAKLEDIQFKRKWLNQKLSSHFIANPVEEIEDTRWYKQPDAPISFEKSTNTFSSKLSDKKHAYLSYQRKKH